MLSNKLEQDSKKFFSEVEEIQDDEELQDEEDVIQDEERDDFYTSSGRIRYSEKHMECLPVHKQFKYRQFYEDLEGAGYEVYFYRGRSFYEGPAVDIDNIDDLQDVIRSTSINVQWDSMGLGNVVYVK